MPLELPLQLDLFGALHVLASWVWTAGEDFCSPAGDQATFTHPRAFQAIHDHFALLRSLPREARRILKQRSSGLFERGLAAINFGTLMFYGNYPNAPGFVQENWRTAPLPGEHFMGGSNLVVWKHTRNDRAALELVRFLTSPEVQVRLAPALAAMPPRLSALVDRQIVDNPILSVFAESIQTGRAYRNVPLWGLIEDHLVSTLEQIGQAVLEEEPVAMEKLLHQHLDPLVRKLNITLAN